MITTATDSPPSRKKLLTAARALMLAQGFAATSLDQICEKAGLTKGCFFHYFDGKEALGKALLSEWAQSLEDGRSALFGDAPDPLDRVYHYIDSFAALAREGSLGKGCLLGVFAGELADVPQIRQACAEGFKAWSAPLARELEAARKKRAPRARFDAAALADHFVALIEGAILVAKARKDPAVIVAGARQYRDYVARLFASET